MADMKFQIESFKVTPKRSNARKATSDLINPKIGQPWRRYFRITVQVKDVDIKIRLHFAIG